MFSKKVITRKLEKKEPRQQPCASRKKKKQWKKRVIGDSQSGNEGAKKLKLQKYPTTTVMDAASSEPSASSSVTVKKKTNNIQERKMKNLKVQRQQEMQDKSTDDVEKLEKERSSSLDYRKKMKPAPFYQESRDSKLLGSWSDEEEDVAVTMPDIGGPQDMKDVWQIEDPVPEISAAEQLLRKRQLVGVPLSIVSPTTKPSVFVALAPKTTLYFQGILDVTVLAGKVDILGYTMKEGETRTVHSIPSMALLGVKVMEGRTVNPSEPSIKSGGVPGAWIHDVVKKQPGPMALVEFQKHNTPKTKFMVDMGWGWVFECPEQQKHWGKLNAIMITPENCDHYNIFEEGPTWRDVGDNLVASYRYGTRPTVVITGGKGVGKSMLLRFLTNYLLSEEPKGVICIDSDLGQSEFSVPTTMSVVQLLKPLLCPAHMNDIKTLGERYKEILVGVTNPQFSLERFSGAFDRCFLETQKFLAYPIIINTMGWTEGTGYGILVDIIRITDPTHVIQINSKSKKKNFHMQLIPQVIIDAKESYITMSETVQCCYSHIPLDSISKGSPGVRSLSPKQLRELHVLNEVSNLLLKRKDESILIKIPWKTVGIHVCEEQVPKERILQAINGQLITLVASSHNDLLEAGKEFPKIVSSEKEFYVHAWGIVRGIDPEAREIHVLTELDPKMMEYEVNCIIQPRIHLPAAVYKYFCKGVGPYIEKSSKGAARLRVARQIKPRT